MTSTMAGRCGLGAVFPPNELAGETAESVLHWGVLPGDCVGRTACPARWIG